MIKNSLLVIFYFDFMINHQTITLFSLGSPVRKLLFLRFGLEQFKH